MFSPSVDFQTHRCSSTIFFNIHIYMYILYTSYRDSAWANSSNIQNLMESPCPPDFRCPISRELMRDPVTISTGITYERENIEKWFFTYQKTTCPATMQRVENFYTTPNHTLKRLILAWSSLSQGPSTSAPPSPERHQELLSLLKTVESSPFKVINEIQTMHKNIGVLFHA